MVTVARLFFPKSTYFSPRSFTPTSTSPVSSSDASFAGAFDFLVDYARIKSEQHTHLKIEVDTYRWFGSDLGLLHRLFQRFLFALI